MRISHRCPTENADAGVSADCVSAAGGGTFDDESCAWKYMSPIAPQTIVYDRIAQ